MPDTGSPWNIPYVEAADLVRDWPADSLLVANAVAAGLSAAGGLVSVASSVRSTAFTTTSSAFVDVTGFAVTMTPQDATNDIVLMLLVNNYSASVSTNAVALQINDGSSNVIPTTFGILTTSAGAGFAYSGSGGVIVSAGSTASRTYQIKLASPSSSLVTLSGATLFVFEVKV